MEHWEGLADENYISEGAKRHGGKKERLFERKGSFTRRSRGAEVTIFSLVQKIAYHETVVYYRRTHIYRHTHDMTRKKHSEGRHTVQRRRRSEVLTQSNRDSVRGTLKSENYTVLSRTSSVVELFNHTIPFCMLFRTHTSLRRAAFFRASLLVSLFSLLSPQ